MNILIKLSHLSMLTFLATISIANADVMTREDVINDLIEEKIIRCMSENSYKMVELVGILTPVTDILNASVKMYKSGKVVYSREFPKLVLTNGGKVMEYKLDGFYRFTVSQKSLWHFMQMSNGKIQKLEANKREFKATLSLGDDEGDNNYKVNCSVEKY